MAVSGQQLTDRDRERIRKMREQGVSVRVVATAMGCSPTTVQKILQKTR